MITCKVSILKNIVNSLKRVLVSNPVNAILDNVLIEVSNEYVLFTASSLDNTIKIKVEPSLSFLIFKECKMCVDLRMLSGIVNSLSCEMATIEAMEDKVKLYSETKTKVYLTNKPHGNYPSILFVKENKFFEGTFEKVKSLFSLHTLTDTTKQNLFCLHLTNENVIATDGCVAGIHKHNFDLDNLSIDIKTVKLLLSSSEDKECKVIGYTDDVNISFVLTADDYEISFISKKINLVYPADTILSLFKSSTSCDGIVSLDNVKTKNLFELASTIDNNLFVIFRPESIDINSASQIGNANLHIDSLSKHTNEIAYCLSYKLISKVIKSLSKDKNIKIKYSIEGKQHDSSNENLGFKPIFIGNESETKVYLIMPITPN